MSPVAQIIETPRVPADRKDTLGGVEESIGGAGASLVPDTYDKAVAAEARLWAMLRLVQADHRETVDTLKGGKRGGKREARALAHPDAIALESSIAGIKAALADVRMRKAALYHTRTDVPTYRSLWSIAAEEIVDADTYRAITERVAELRASQ